MDLNDLYFRHQLSVMRAKAAGNERTRSTHQGYADELARRIGDWQRRAGAGAAAMWGLCLPAAPGRLPCSDAPTGLLS